MHGKGRLKAEFVRVGSGRKDAGPQLAAALALCRGKAGRLLLIAYLDCLARSVAFILSLMESGVAFVAAEMPHANKLAMHILAAVAEHKRESDLSADKGRLGSGQGAGNPLRPDMPNARAALLPAMPLGSRTL